MNDTLNLSQGVNKVFEDPKQAQATHAPFLSCFTNIIPGLLFGGRSVKREEIAELSFPSQKRD